MTIKEAIKIVDEAVGEQCEKLGEDQEQAEARLSAAWAKILKALKEVGQ